MSEMFPDEDWREGAEVDLRDVGSTCCYCSGQSAQEVRTRLDAVPPDAVHLIDSGDFHYLTLFFLERIREPFRLLLLDNHPDDQAPALAPDLLSCGSWVAAARSALPNLREVCWNRVPASKDLPVYVSLDLDFLDAKYFETDWSQGTASPGELYALLNALRPPTACGPRILGVDVCGGLTVSKGATARTLSLNSATRKALLGFLQEWATPRLQDR